MPEYQLQIVSSSPDRMNLAEAREYAPQWGSLIRTGDPGAVMYGDPSETETARAMLAHIESDLLPKVKARAHGWTATDEKELGRLASYLRTVGAESDWERASALERGFIECLFFLASDDPESDEGDISGEGAVSELSPCAWDDVRKACAAFAREAGADTISKIAVGFPDYGPTQAGHDLCFTAQGAGVGFTDREAELGERDAWEAAGSPRVGDPGWNGWQATRESLLSRALDRAARAAVPYCEGLYRGDDGLLYLYINVKG